MAVIACELTSRHALADGRAFGTVGPYEQLDGTAHFAVDPTHSLNRGITDLHLAPRDDNGLVRFAADVRILTPVDSQRGNHRLLFDVPNRGIAWHSGCSITPHVRRSPVCRWIPGMVS
jgi:hypothetical protein